jgi:glucose/arabinose dehydrogenase
VITLGALAAPALAQLGAPGPVTGLFKTNCASCHAESGEGGPMGTPSLLKDEYFNPARDREYFNAIKNGLPNTSMNAFKESLTDPQIWALVVHVRELQYKHMRDAGPGVTPKRAAAGTVFKTQHASFTIENVVATGLDTPWAVTFLPSESPLAKPDTPNPAGLPPMLITERDGSLRLFAQGKLSGPIAGIPKVYASGQGGLMDVKLHPDYAKPGVAGGWVYLTLSDPKTIDGRQVTTTKVVRGKLNKADGPEGALTWTDQQTVFESKPEHYIRTGLHFGSRLAFDPPGPAGERERYLFFTIGEHGRGNDADDLTKPNGKVHRLHDDGRVPADNPFVDVKGAVTSIWSYGHRNPQGLVFGLDGKLWSTEHAPRGGDELNLVVKGAHFGWPVLSFGINYNDTPYQTPFPDISLAANTAGLNSTTADRGKPNPTEVTQPAHRWIPSIAACGLTVVAKGPLGEAFPAWNGDLLAGGLAAQTVQRVRVKDGVVTEVEEVFHDRGRVRDVTTAPDGSIVIVLNGPDRVVRLVPAPAK